MNDEDPFQKMPADLAAVIFFAALCASYVVTALRGLA